MNISTFIGITGNLHNRRVFLQRETIFCQFRTIDSMKATPEKVFLSIVFDIQFWILISLLRNNLPRSVNGPSGLSAVAIPIPHVHSPPHVDIE